MNINMSSSNPFSTSNAQQHNLVSKIIGTSPYQVAVDLVDIHTVHTQQLGSSDDSVNQAYIGLIGDIGSSGSGYFQELAVGTIYCNNIIPSPGGGTGSGPTGATGPAGAAGAPGVTGPTGSADNVVGGTGIQVSYSPGGTTATVTNTGVIGITAGANVYLGAPDVNGVIAINAIAGGTASIPTGPNNEIVVFGVTGVTSSPQLTFDGSEMVIPTTQVITPGQIGRMRLTNSSTTSFIQSGLRSVIGDGNILNIGPYSSGSSVTQFDTQNAKVSLGGALNPDPTSQKIQVSGNTVITGTNGPGQYGTTFQTSTTAGTTALPGITGTVYNIYAWGQGGTGQGARAGGEIEILGLTGGNITWSFAGGGASISGNTGGNALYVGVLGVTGVAYGGGGGGGVTGAGGNATAVTGGSGGVSTQTIIEQRSFGKTGDVLSNVTIVGSSTFQTSGFLTIPAGATLTSSAEHVSFSGGATFDILTFPAGTTFSIQGTGVTGSGLFTSGVTAIYSPYSNLNVGVAGVSASGVTGNGQQIVDGTTGISGSNVEFFNSSGISETIPVSMSGNVQSAFSGSGPVYIYLENLYQHVSGTNIYTITGNCAYALVASGSATPTPPPISASFNTTSQTSTVLPSYTTTAGTEIRTVSSIISVRGITGTTLGGAGVFGGGGGGFFGGGGGIVGGAGGNGSSSIIGITGSAANNGSGADGYRNRYNNYVYGGAQQSGAIVIETVNTSNATPTLTVNGTVLINGSNNALQLPNGSLIAAGVQSTTGYTNVSGNVGVPAVFPLGLLANGSIALGNTVSYGLTIKQGPTAPYSGCFEYGSVGDLSGYSIKFGPTGASNIEFNDGGAVGYSLTVKGLGGSTFAYDAYGSDFIIRSDSRLKQNIVTVDSALDKVMKLRGVYFNKLDDPTRRIGVIAQEVEEVLPEVVHTDDSPDKMKAVSYANIVGLLIEAIKEQQEIIKKLM
jgi:hypothetical protein